MKKFTILFLAVVFGVTVNAGIIYVPSNATDNSKAGDPNIAMSMKEKDAQAFLSLTPAKVEQLTGKKMNFVQKMALKAAQKNMRKGGSTADIPKGLYIVLAIFGLAWIAMGIFDNWKGSTWIVNLILTLLFWLPGFIHALVVMKNYYK